MSVSRIVLTAGFLLTSGLAMPSTAEASSHEEIEIRASVRCNNEWPSYRSKINSKLLAHAAANLLLEAPQHLKHTVRVQSNYTEKVYQISPTSTDVKWRGKWNIELHGTFTIQNTYGGSEQHNWITKVKCRSWMGGKYQEHPPELSWLGTLAF